MKKLIFVISFILLTLTGFTKGKPHTNYIRNIQHNNKWQYGLIFEVNKDIVFNEYSLKGIPAIDKGFYLAINKQNKTYAASVVWSDYTTDKIQKVPQINFAVIIHF